MNPLITLITDLGADTAAIAAIKGRIYADIPEARIVDIGHHVPQFDHYVAAIELTRVQSFFPEGTLHIIAVDDELALWKRYLLAKGNNAAVMAPDNGIISLLPEALRVEVLLVPEAFYQVSNFPAAEILVPAAINFLKNGSNQWQACPNPVTKTLSRPFVTDENIKGHALYVDSYGNVITNITKSLFTEKTKGRKFAIYVNRFDKIERVSNTYSDVPRAEALCYFNRQDLLVIAMNRQNAAKLLNIKPQSTITIDLK